jgi:hypothetical protein
MSEANPYPDGIEYRPPRPRGTTLAAILGSLLGYAITEKPEGAVVGGVVGGALGDIAPPLEVAIRQFFEQNDPRINRRKLKMHGFYRQGSHSIKITVGIGNSFWEIESRAPSHPDWTQESIENWLYGDLVYFQLPKFIAQIEARVKKRVR